MGHGPGPGRVPAGGGARARNARWAPVQIYTGMRLRIQALARACGVRRGACQIECFPHYPVTRRPEGPDVRLAAAPPPEQRGQAQAADRRRARRRGDRGDARGQRAGPARHPARRGGRGPRAGAVRGDAAHGRAHRRDRHQPRPGPPRRARRRAGPPARRAATAACSATPAASRPLLRTPGRPPNVCCCRAAAPYGRPARRTSSGLSYTRGPPPRRCSTLPGWTPARTAAGHSPSRPGRYASAAKSFPRRGCGGSARWSRRLP